MEQRLRFLDAVRLKEGRARLVFEMGAIYWKAERMGVNIMTLRDDGCMQ